MAFHFIVVDISQSGQKWCTTRQATQHPQSHVASLVKKYCWRHWKQACSFLQCLFQASLNLQPDNLQQQEECFYLLKEGTTFFPTLTSPSLYPFVSHLLASPRVPIHICWPLSFCLPDPSPSISPSRHLCSSDI